MEAVNWEAIAAIAEVIGLIVVIASLIYLATEIRQNTASVNTARYETITTGFNDIDAAIVADPELASLFNLAMYKPDELNESQQARLAFVFRMFYNQYDKIFHLYRTGVLSKDEWETYAKQAGTFLGSPGGRKFIESNPDYPELIGALESYFAQQTAFEFSFAGRDTPNTSSEPHT